MCNHFCGVAHVSQAACLENVLGIKPVLPDVVAHIEKELPDYKVSWTILSPNLSGHFDRRSCKHCNKFPRNQFGMNVARQRYYFFLIHKDYLSADLDSSISRTVEDLIQPNK